MEKIQEILNVVRDNKIDSQSKLEEKGYNIDEIFKENVHQKKKLGILLRRNKEKKDVVGE